MGADAAGDARIRNERTGDRVTSGRSRILLIEDNRFLRRACEIGLTARGFSVTSAVDGEDGLQRALAQRPDLILLDLMMPKMSGLEALRALRQAESTREVPVLVLSNSPREQYIDEVTKLGAVGYLIKANLRLDDLADHITGVLDAASVAKPGEKGTTHEDRG